MTHKIAVQVNPLIIPSRAELVEYIKTAVGEGYQPEHEAAISDLGVIELLDDHSLNREYGKCWQWYNMGGGFHETFDKNTTQDHALMSEAKPQDGSKVQGYRTLSERDIMEMNQVKDISRHFLAKLDTLKSTGDDPRWLAIAKTHMQEACMAACRAITQPDGDC